MKKNISKLNKVLKFGGISALFIFLGLGFLFPLPAFSASLTASSTSSISAGDTSIIDIFLDTEGTVINSIDGSIVLSDEHQGNFEIRDISLVNSMFTMWPRKPSLEANKKISFIGVVPGGVEGDRVLLFRLIVKINQSGNFNITPNNIRAYLNDGLGTSVSITPKSSTINVSGGDRELKDSWREIISNDNTAPAPFVIEILSDSNLFDGKKFINFETTDLESGISHYEVKEGSYPAVRTGTNYVLINQDKEVDIIVTAYDKAGNCQVATLLQDKPINWKGIVIALALILVIYKIINFMWTRNKIRQNVH
jgi:hypothetical protein